MLVTARNVDPRAPDLAPALRNGQTLWTFPLQKVQWASNASNDTDLCYPGTASLEKRIEKVSSDAMSVDRPLRPRSPRPPVRPKFLCEQIRLSMQACNSQPSSKAKKSETELLGRLFSVKVYRQQPKVRWKLVTIPFALPPFVLEPIHYQCLCKSSIQSGDAAYFLQQRLGVHCFVAALLVGRVERCPASTKAALCRGQKVQFGGSRRERVILAFTT